MFVKNFQACPCGKLNGCITVSEMHKCSNMEISEEVDFYVKEDGTKQFFVTKPSTINHDVEEKIINYD